MILLLVLSQLETFQANCARQVCQVECIDAQRESTITYWNLLDAIEEVLRVIDVELYTSTILDGIQESVFSLEPPIDALTKVEMYDHD